MSVVRRSVGYLQHYYAVHDSSNTSEMLLIFPNPMRHRCGQLYIESDATVALRLIKVGVSPCITIRFPHIPFGPTMVAGRLCRAEIAA